MKRMILCSIAALIAAPAFGMSRLALLVSKELNFFALFASEAKSKKMAYQKRFCTLKKTKDKIEDLRNLIVLMDRYKERSMKNWFTGGVGFGIAVPSGWLSLLEMLDGSGLSAPEVYVPGVAALFAAAFTAVRTCYYHSKYIKPVKKELDKLSEIEGID